MWESGDRGGAWGGLGGVRLGWRVSLDYPWEVEGGAFPSERYGKWECRTFPIFRLSLNRALALAVSVADEKGNVNEARGLGGGGWWWESTPLDIQAPTRQDPVHLEPGQADPGGSGEITGRSAVRGGGWTGGAVQSWGLPDY